MDLEWAEIPTFKFAIREDLKNSKISFLPNRATELSTGWDVRVATPDGQQLLIHPGQYVKIPLGFRTFCPPGWWFELKPRSSTFAKKHLHCLYGTVDTDYEGELIFACQYMPDLRCFPKELTLDHGEAIGQIVPVKRQEMIVENISNIEYDELCKQRNAQRKAGGFGSTRK